MNDRSKFLESARYHLELAALAYARMKAFGFYVDGKGHHCYVTNGDRQLYLASQTEAMQDAANKLLVELQAVELPPRKESP